MTGTLYGVGVGPGDPELITLKALRILAGVPVVAYPAPETGDSLARAIVAPHLAAGKEELAIRMVLAPERFPDESVYREAAGTIAGHLEAGRDVAVLCEGDPFFYGSFMYLFALLAERYPLQVVPGVSSPMACAAVLGMPLAAQNDVLTVLPAPLASDVLRARLTTTDAAAIIKLGRHFPRIRALLDEMGLADGARYVERATMGAQRVVPIGEVDPATAPYFSMILIHKRGAAWHR